MVQNKHFPEDNSSIIDYSLPIKLLSEKKINIVRFYIRRDKKEEASIWCKKRYEEIKAEIKDKSKGWG